MPRVSRRLAVALDERGAESKSRERRAESGEQSVQCRAAGIWSRRRARTELIDVFTCSLWLPYDTRYAPQRTLSNRCSSPFLLSNCVDAHSPTSFDTT
jgi:hypothetical protein